MNLLLIASAVFAAGPRPDPTFHEQVVGEIAAGSSFKGIRISGTHIAWVEDSAGKRTVRLDGNLQGGTYDDADHLSFSPGAAHFVFFGKRGSSWTFVLDGQELPEQYDLVSTVDFASKKDSYAFVGCQAMQCRLNVSGTKSGPVYDASSYPQYSRDGKKLAFLGARDGQWFAVVNGKEQGPGLEKVWPQFWGFTDDGSRFYVAGRLNGKWTYIVDGEPGPAFGVVSPIAFSPDYQHYAYGGTIVKGGALRKKTIGTIVVDGKAGGTYEGSGMPGSLALAAGAWEWMLGGVRYLDADFHGVSAPWFTATGKIVYTVRRGKKGQAVMVGGESGPVFQHIISPVALSRDTSQVVYIARHKGEFQEVRNHQVVRTFSLSKMKRRMTGITRVQKGNRPTTFVSWMRMSRDGAHLAYEIVSGGGKYAEGDTQRALRCVVIDGEAGPEYDARGIGAFDATRDADHYLYEVIGASGDKDLVNVDGLESALYDDAWALHFSDDEKEAVFIARRDRQLLRVTLPLN